MLLSRFFEDTKATLVNTYREQGWSGLWETVLLPVGVPLLLGLGMSVLLAKFIVDGDWALVFGLLLLVPAMILFLTYPFSAVLIWIALMPFLQTTPDTTFRTAYWLVHRAMPVGALGIVVLSSMLGLSKLRRPVKLGFAELAMALYLGLGVVNILRLEASPLSNLYLFYDRVFVPMSLYLLIRLVAPGRKDVQRLLPIALLLVVVEAGAAILAQFAPQVLPADWLRLGAARGTGTMDNPYTYSLGLVFFGLLLYHGAMQRKSGVVRTIYLLGFGLAAFGVFLAFSRGTWLGAVVAFAGLLFLYPKATVRVTAVILVIAVILGGVVFTAQVDWARERLGAEETALDRWVIWDAGLQMIGEKPLLGWGYDSYSDHAGQFQRRVQNYVAAFGHASHNAYFTIAAELGLLALLLFLFPVFWWLRHSFKSWRRMPKAGFWSRPLLAIFWLIMLDHAIVTFFTDIRHSTYAQGLWWITLGLIATMAGYYFRADEPVAMAESEWTKQSRAEEQAE